jgi:hypothetical protein
MTQSELEPRTRGWLRWEWRAALITVIGSTILILGTFGYLSYRVMHLRSAYNAASRQQSHINAAAEIALCTAALDHAKAFGIVPNYGKLSGPGLQLTTVKGRYACTAATSVTRYTILSDLLCRDLRDQRCTALYSVLQQDGTILYRRQQ